MSRALRPRRSNYYVPALEKGLDLLETLAASPRPLSLADLSRSLARTSSEIFRMVDTLERRQYIIRDAATGAYRLSMKLYELSHVHSPVEQLTRAAADPMRELSLEVSESCHLAVISGDQLIVVMEELSPARVRISVELGSAAPVLQTVSGRLLMAYMDETELDAYLERLGEYRDMSRPRREALRAELREIREQGYAIRASAYRTGIDVAVAVGNPQVRVVASLAIPVLSGGVNEGREKHLLRALRQCAGKINEGLRLSAPVRGRGEDEKGEVA